MSGPGLDHGASSPAALNRAQYASSSSTVRAVWTAMAVSFVIAPRPAGPQPRDGLQRLKPILAEHAALPAVEADRDSLTDLGRLAGIDLDAHARPVVEPDVAVHDVTEERHLRDFARNRARAIRGRRRDQPKTLGTNRHLHRLAGDHARRQSGADRMLA